jgi:hypothetical protein
MMFNRFQTVTAAAALAAGIGTAAFLANAQDTKPTMSPPTAAGKAASPSVAPVAPTPPAATPGAADSGSPAEATKPASWVGLPVVTSDGQMLGQVTELKPAADGKSSVLVVKSTGDNKTFVVPSGIAKMSGRSVQLSATSQELKSTVQ